MSVKVVTPGFLTTIQDKGRSGFAEYGVPKSGAMDAYAAKVANLLVGNTADKAVMEITMQGPELEFQESALVAVAGLQVHIELNNRSVDCNTAFQVAAGDRLNIKQVTQGVRAYLAVYGGYLTPKVLGSCSFYEHITPVKKLQKAAELPITSQQQEIKNSHATVKFKAALYDAPKLKAFPGPEWHKLSQILKEKLLSQRFTVSKNNSRMAYQLAEKIKNDLPSILTQPVLPGTVQFTPAGNLIILMRDCQTTGGYPRVLQVHEKSLNYLAQKRTGESIRFALTDYPG